MVPLQVLADIDNARNPMQLTRERLERAATENQFMNGKIVALDVRGFLPLFLFLCGCWVLDVLIASGLRFQSYRQHLDQALALSFPELVPHLRPPPSVSHTMHPSTQDVTSQGH